MKSVNLIIAALASISSARSAAVRQEDVTPEKVCDWFETGRHNSATNPDENCRSSAQRCIEDQVKKSNVSDQVTKDDIILCTFSPMIGNDTTDFMTVCDGLDVTHERCHSNTAWCVMDHAAFAKGKAVKNTALAEIQTCVAMRILNPDGDDTSIKCNSTQAGADLGRTICDEDYSGEKRDKCKEEFDRKTPKSDILKHTQLSQYCQDQGVECSNCKMYPLDPRKANRSYIADYIIRIDRSVIECQARAQTSSQTESKEACSSTPSADKQPKQSGQIGQPGQPQQSLEEVDRQLKEHCNRPGVNTKDCMFAARRCTGQVKVDATTKEFLECVDRMQQVKPW
ncbi:hypothetical protein MY11210_008402 [Beauveria gryllotalpidicola]